MDDVTQRDREADGQWYLANRFQWAAPGDQQEDAWLVRFCDKDCGDAIFTGPNAEQEAREYWNRYAPSYNLYVFRLASLGHRTADAARIAELEGEVARLRAFAQWCESEQFDPRALVFNARAAQYAVPIHRATTALGGKAGEQDPNILHIRIDRRHCSSFSLEIDEQADTTTAEGQS